MRVGKNKNLFMMLGLGVLIICSLVFLGKMEKSSDEKKLKEMPTIEQYQNVVVDKEIDGFDYANQPSMGEENAPIKVVEFGDYKCPHCAAWKSIVFPQLYQEYIATGEVEFYFLNFQFLAEDSVLAGLAGEAIYQQSEDAFWTYYDEMFKNQGLESEMWANKDFIMSLVKEKLPEIDLDRFESDISEFKYLEDVRYDMMIGNSHGVKGTPAVFIDGTRVENNSFEGMQQVIEAKLAQEVE